MTGIRALIADDEALSRRLVEQLLARHADVTIVGACADGVETREAMAALAPDVVFLDVRMPAASGLDVACDRNARDGPLVVFVTAYDAFALPAFDVDAVDFLTKPLNEARFDAALDRVRERLRLRRSSTLDSAPPVPATIYRRHLMSRIGAREVIVPLDTVEYIEASDVYALVVAGGKRHLVRTALDALERELDPDDFVRVHRSFIVHTRRIREIRRAGPGALVLVTGAVVPISRRRRAHVDAALRRIALKQF